jgi:hypothetical protein
MLLQIYPILYTIFVQTECSIFPSSSQINPIVVGGVPLGSSSSFLQSWQPTFEKYLFDTVGTLYNPPLNFSLIPLTLSNAFQMVNERRVQFIYSNPSLYSCLESEYSGKEFEFLCVQYNLIWVYFKLTQSVDVTICV